MKGKKNDGLILFCFDAESLGNETVKWICTRFGDSISISEKNTLLRRIPFFYNSGDKPGLLYHIQIDESNEEPKLVLDYERTYEYDLIVVDEGHHILNKKSESVGMCSFFSRSEHEKRRKKRKRILKKNKNAQAMILCDSSQAPSTKLKWPKEFNKEDKLLTFTEVIRSLPLLTEASSLFQRFNQDKTTNLNSKLKGQGLCPGAIMFKSEGYDKDYQTYASKIVDEMEKIMSFFPNENLHDSVAVIVSNGHARTALLNVGLDTKLDKMGFRAVTAKEASERFSTDPPSDGRDYIIVDMISHMNGLERLFVIVVDMDKPTEKIEDLYPWSSNKDAKAINQRNLEAEERNQKNLSEIYCACTRGMLYVSFVNKYIKDGWMSLFQFTESEEISRSTPIHDIRSSSGVIINDFSNVSSTTQAMAKSDQQGKLDLDEFFFLRSDIELKICPNVMPFFALVYNIIKDNDSQSFEIFPSSSSRTLDRIFLDSHTR